MHKTNFITLPKGTRQEGLFPGPSCAAARDHPHAIDPASLSFVRFWGVVMFEFSFDVFELAMECFDFTLRLPKLPSCFGETHAESLVRVAPNRKCNTGYPPPFVALWCSITKFVPKMMVKPDEQAPHGLDTPKYCHKLFTQKRNAATTKVGRKLKLNPTKKLHDTPRYAHRKITLRNFGYTKP